MSGKDSASRAFYTECLDDFHAAAGEMGFAEKGVLLIPDIVPYETKIIMALLQDEFYRKEFAEDATSYYYAISMLSLQAGMICAHQWHSDSSQLNDENVDKLIEFGPADAADDLWRQEFGMSPENADGFYKKIYSRWLEKMRPHWGEEDPRDYIFNAVMAAFQLGISIMLEKIGI